VPSPGIARTDWEILVDLSGYFDALLGYSLPQEIWNEISTVVPAYEGIAFGEIGKTGARSRALQPA
jgi:predicted molibdopterin-dependent oxidoreductase YjgC